MSAREVRAISQFLNMDPQGFIKDYCQWSGERPFIRSSESGYCIFWNKICTIHPVKPRMCKTWPFIESILVDPTNWESMRSVCPGIRARGTLEDLIECVKQVQTQYEKG